jgi:hypothetical protein
MNSSKEILDLPDKTNDISSHFENRVWRDLLIVVGILFSLLGLTFLILTILDVFRTIEAISTNDWYAQYFSWGRWLFSKSFTFLYIVCFLIGGLGLVRCRILGWIFSLALSVFSILFIGITILRIGYSFDGSLGAYAWILFAIVLFFSLIIFLLLSKPIREYFRPTKRTVGFVGLILLVFAIDFTAILVFT